VTLTGFAFLGGRVSEETTRALLQTHSFAGKCEVTAAGNAQVAEQQVARSAAGAVCCTWTEACLAFGVASPHHDEQVLDSPVLNCGVGGGD